MSFEVCSLMKGFWKVWVQQKSQAMTGRGSEKKHTPDKDPTKPQIVNPILIDGYFNCRGLNPNR